MSGSFLKTLANNIYLILFGYFINIGFAPAIDLGQQLPDNAIAKNELVLVSSAQLQKSYKVTQNGIEYSVTVNSDNLINFITTNSVKFKTLEGASVGIMLSELREYTSQRIIVEAGWGYYIELPSGWNAAFCLGKGCTSNPLKENSKVSWYFKRINDKVLRYG